MLPIDKAKELVTSDKIRAILQTEDDIKTKVEQISDFSSQESISYLKEAEKLNLLKELVNSLEIEIRSYNEAQNNLNEEGFREIAEEQLKLSEDKLIKINTEIEALTITPLKNDEKKAIFEIRPGVGGIESALFAQELFRMYTNYLKNQNIGVEIFSIVNNEEGGINEAVFLVNEDGSYGRFRFEGGVHRVQRVPKTEAMGRIHTSTVSVAVIPKFEEKSIDINPNDLKIDVYRSSGPGGQSVNTTDSAVRITHIPSGITVTCQNGKSQHKNKEMALSVLFGKLQEIEEQKKELEEKALRKASVDSADRSAKIRTYNFPQSRITDHRINESWFNINEVMEGGLDEIIKMTSLKLRQE